MSRARDNANLGAQAGSGLDASDITTGVLPVGVTGGSGLTALGTGIHTTASSDGGHIRQCVLGSVAGEISDDISSSTFVKPQESSTYHWKAIILDVLASSKILITMCFKAYIGRDSTIESNYGFEVVRQNTGTVTATSGTVINTQSNGAYMIHIATASSGHIAMSNIVNFTTIDDSPDTGSNTYYLTGACGGGALKIDSRTSTFPFTCIMQEIIV